MNWQSLLDIEIQKFIRAHEKDDVAALALKKPPNADWDYPLILDQIKARQKARVKIPLWADHHPNIIFPPAAILEQASSAATARYKAGLIRGENFVDLTGGTGVDSCALTEHYKNGIIIEHNQHAANLIAHNLPLLTDKKIEVLNIAAEEYVPTMLETDLVIIDPQRRDTQRKGKFQLSDCSPDITALLPTLQNKAKTILLKTSPMLDISQAITQLGNVNAVHVLEWRGDCKELVFIIGENPVKTPPITAVSLNDEGEAISTLTFTLEEERTTTAELSKPLRYLYEPGPAFQKSGAFNTMSKHFNVKKLHPHTHLYTSETLKTDFPGRTFKIIEQYPVQAGKIPLKKANLTVRNFPMNAPDLRKKLKIKDGGEDTLFACTLEDGSKILLHGKKA